MSTFTCDDCRKHWGPFADGELDRATQAAVQGHLRSCPGCRERFERESAFEEGLRARWRATYMPDALWDDLTERVRANRTVRRLPVLWPLAMAASLGIVTLLGVYVGEQRQQARDTTVVEARHVHAEVADLLQAVRPSLEMFEAPVASSVATDLAVMSSRLLGCELAVVPQATDHHRPDLIDVREATDPMGHPYLEVHLNCCGRPVLLAVTAADQPTCIAELQCCKRRSSQQRACKLPCGKPSGRSCRIESSSVERGGLRIAAAAADHDVNLVLNALQIRPI